MRPIRVFTATLVVVMAALGLSTALALDLKPEYYVVKDFKLISGAVLPEMKVEYAVAGTPKKDVDGKITNAVVFCHGWSGNYNQINIMKGVIGSDKSVNPERFFYIFPTALGSPGSSCPSVSGAGPDFPKYNIADMIAAQYLLVKDHLKIDHLAGVMGASMGGAQTLQWITDHPEMVDWAIGLPGRPVQDSAKGGDALSLHEHLSFLFHPGILCHQIQDPGRGDERLRERWPRQ
jgi:homoserine acetyltransferase